MANKYRLKLEERIIGPFSISQITELFIKGKIDGTEECQLFPAGKWETIGAFKDISKELIAASSRENTKATVELDSDKTIANLKLIAKHKIQVVENKKLLKGKKIEKITKLENEAKKDDFKEFSFDKTSNINVDYDSLEKKYQNEVIKNNKIENTKDEEVAKTVIISNPLKKKENFDKTLIVNPQILKELKESKIDNSEPEIEPIKEDTIDLDESTQFIKLDDLNISAQAGEVDEVEKELREAKRLEKESVGTNHLNKKSSSVDDNDDHKEKKKLTPILALVAILVIGLLLFDEDDSKKNTIEPRRVRIGTPVTQEIIDFPKSKESYRKAIEYYKKQTYLGKIYAASSFKKSLEYKFKDNDALGKLILVYAELFENATDRKEAVRTLFRLIQISKNKSLKDINTVMGIAIFYAKAGKAQTSIRNIENFIKLNKPSVKLFSIYLDALLTTGDLIKARKVFDKLSGAPNKVLETYIAMERFYKQDDLKDKSEEIITEGLRKFPKSVKLLLKKSDYSINSGNFKQLKKILKIVRELNAEQSPIYYAKYLEQLGVVSAAKKDNKNAVKFFKKALKIYDSSELRYKLAALQVGGGSAAESLIIESKIIKLMKQSRVKISEKDWDSAFKFSIEAADLSESFTPAHLLLAEIQAIRGYFESSIKTLVKLRKENPADIKITFNLISSYIHALKLNDAKIQLSIISQTKLSETFEYASLWARYYMASNNFVKTVEWLERSIKRNPLADEDYYLLAKLFLKKRHYKASRAMISKAITLDPVNENYQSLFSKILFELDGADVAIGYLRDRLLLSPDNAKYLGDIATYYYKNGQIKQFQEYEDKIKKLVTNNPNLYKFLINSMLIEKNYKDLIIYSNQLLEIEPGDLKARMLLGKAYLETGDFTKALETFETVTDRLNSYPKVHYNKAKVYIAMKKYRTALEEGKLEIKLNPSLYHGYYICGEVTRRMAKYKESIQFLEKSITIDSKSVEALMAFGWIKMRQRYYEPARELYLRAKRLQPNNPEIYKQLGFIYQAIGQGALAVEEFKVYLQLDPGAHDRKEIERIISNLKR